MFPISDESKIRGKTSLITIVLIFLNVFFFFISFKNLDFYINNFGLVPERIFQGEALFSLIFAMFLHGGFSHLFGNMWFLWIFGDNLERKLGKLKFLFFYLLSGIGSGLIYSFLVSDKTVPVIGASGAISGVLAGYLVLFPRNKIRALVPGFFSWYIISVPALFYIGIWFLYQFLYLGPDPFVAYWGHIGGFITGLILISLFKKYENKI